jgi:squalene-associated FAD-dependent desaturase
MSQVHVIGAGLAGLAAALSLTAAGRKVTLHEAGGAAGGRCRSYFDKELGLRIDNGNHLLLSGNLAALSFIAETGAADRFRHDVALFPFIDLQTGERWTVRPNKGRIPWWVLFSGRRVANTRLSDYMRMSSVARIRDNTTVVADSMRRGWLYWRLLEPLAIAALNTRPQVAMARLLAAVMRETLMRGGAACIPWLPKEGLSEALIDPAITTLTARGADIRFNSRIAGLTLEGGRVTALRGPDGEIPLGADDSVVLAVPAWVAADLLPGLVTPNAFEAILNIHFAVAPPAAGRRSPVGPAVRAGFLGMTSGTAEWVFLKRDHVSVTISAANGMVDDLAWSLAMQVWPNVRQALDLPAGDGEEMPPFRVVKEKRATFAATAQQELRRPKPQTPLAANLVLAGDWTDTGLPATIEGAIRSGRVAAEALLGSVDKRRDRGRRAGTKVKADGY